MGGEDADDRAGEEEKQAVVARGREGAGPDEADRDRADDDRQAGEPDRVAEEADVVGDTEVAEPALPVLQLSPCSKSKPTSDQRTTSAKRASASAPASAAGSGSSQTTSAAASGRDDRVVVIAP